MNDNTRRHFTPQEKVALLRRHLLEHIPISQLCDEFKIVPSQFYTWQREFFENGAAVFAGNGKRQNHADRVKDDKIAALTAKLQRKDEVLAELMEEHVQLKKSLGEA
jgi:transposase